MYNETLVTSSVMRSQQLLVRYGGNHHVRRVRIDLVNIFSQHQLTIVSHVKNLQNPLPAPRPPSTVIIPKAWYSSTAVSCLCGS